ncbi:MAG: BatA domain-containing protein [Gemmatimonadales bacterium]|nr:BatA domain-containing protein [Gemmatimonadales bacterium]
MQWLAPAWLAAALAVAIPILLHLRDQRPPKVIRVGSVADLSSSVVTRRRRHLRDVPLLLLRCAIIVLGAMYLAGPQLTADRPAKRVAVVPTGLEHVTDSLRTAGVRVAEFTPSPHPWTLLTWADSSVGRHDTIVMVAPGGDGRYVGARPRTTHPVEIIAVAETLAATGTAAPPTSQRRPSRDSAVTASRSARDARPAVWWKLVALVAVERVVALRRKW